MEENNSLQIIIEILKWLAAVSVASAPGIFTLLRQRRKDKIERKIREDDAKKITLDTTQKLQDIYQEMIEDLKKQQRENTAKIKELGESVEQLRKENLILKRDNEKLISLIEKQGEKIEESEAEINKLKSIICKLIEQLKSLNITPIVNGNNK